MDRHEDQVLDAGVGRRVNHIGVGGVAIRESVGRSQHELFDALEGRR